MNREGLQQLIGVTGAKVTWEEVEQGPLVRCDFGTYTINRNPLRYELVFLVDEDERKEILDITQVVRTKDGLYPPKQTRIAVGDKSRNAALWAIYQRGYTPIWERMLGAGLDEVDPVYRERLKGVTCSVGLTQRESSVLHHLDIIYRPTESQNWSMNIQLPSPKPEASTIKDVLSLLSSRLGTMDAALDTLAEWGTKLGIELVRKSRADLELHAPKYEVGLRCIPNVRGAASYEVTWGVIRQQRQLFKDLRVGDCSEWTEDLFKALIQRKTLEVDSPDGPATSDLDLV